MSTDTRTADDGARGAAILARRCRSDGQPGRSSIMLVAATVLVLVGAVGLVLELVSPDGTTRGTPARQATARPRSKAAPNTSTPSTTSTTAPHGAAVVRTQGGVITVSVPAGGYLLRFTAQGPCWMRAQRSDNTAVDTTTLHAGDSRELAESGPLTVRLGNPGVLDVAVDGQVLALPLQNGAAVDLHLVPPGSPT